MKRKEFFTDGWKQIGRDLWNSPVGDAIGDRMQRMANLLAPQGLDHYVERYLERTADAGSPASSGDPNALHSLPDEFPRPPGALPDPAAFDEHCTHCGDCVIACPHGTIFTLGGVGPDGRGSGPLVDPNSVACRLCPDMPCIGACATGALQALPKNSLPKFGQAMPVLGACLNETPAPGRGSKKSGGKQTQTCRECKKACPVPDVIQIKQNQAPRFADYCTGCGQCVPACPAEPAAIEISTAGD